MNESAHPLTTEKPAPSICFLIGEFAGHDIREFGRRTRHKLLRRHPPYIQTSAYGVPDSLVCQKAVELVREASPDFLFHHCVRTYAFAVAMAHKVDQPVDREVLFLGCLMHDLGLTPEHDCGGSFELDGAKAAYGFCQQEGLAPERAALVHEMVALHNSVGVATKKDPEIALVHYGAGTDVLSLWSHDINEQTLREILEASPRTGFGEGMARLIEDQIQRKPHSYMASMVKMGFLKRLRACRLAGEATVAPAQVIVQE